MQNLCTSYREFIKFQRDRCFQPTHQTLNYSVKRHKLYRGTMYNDICYQVSIPILIESATILIEGIPMFSWCILILIERITMFIGCIPILIGSIPILIDNVQILINCILEVHEKHSSIFFHEWPLIINYHVLVGQYEMSGSKLLCAVFYFDFSDFVYFP